MKKSLLILMALFLFLASSSGAESSVILYTAVETEPAAETPAAEAVPAAEQPEAVIITVSSVTAPPEASASPSPEAAEASAAPSAGTPDTVETSVTPSAESPVSAEAPALDANVPSASESPAPGVPEATAVPASGTDSSILSPGSEAPDAVEPGTVIVDAAPPKVIDRIHSPGAYPGFSFSEDDDLLDIWFSPASDQDAAIFLYQDQVWMLDCGDERAAEESVPLLRYLGVDHVDKLFNTHPHHDHLNGLYAIDAFFPIKELLICFPEDATVHMTAAMEYCKGNGIPITHFSDESIFSMGDGLVTFLSWQKTAEEESINDRSAQFMVSYGACNILFMADMERRGQHQLYEALGPDPLKADILRYPHHGKTYMVSDVYAAIDPALVIITNVPRIWDLNETTSFLENRHASIAFTRQSEGIIHLTTDGEHWLCEMVPFNPKQYLSPDGFTVLTGISSEASPDPEATSGSGSDSFSVITTSNP